ncbi:MAG: 50S ribosomal protein L23 [Gammaproteobacteria bacterium]|nr:50S ribosomal protein L23 [Gammaproteobacteria bacterium]
MNIERMHKILVEPRLTEKASRVADAHRQFVFKVLRDATKPEIKTAVENLFKVEVESVQTLNVRARNKTSGRSTGGRPAWKKAFVKLKEGHDINLMGAE